MMNTASSSIMKRGAFVAFRRPMTVCGLKSFSSLATVPESRMDISNFAKATDPTTIVTMTRRDLMESGISSRDIETLYASTDMQAAACRFVYLPLTAKTVKTRFGLDLGYKASYMKFTTDASSAVILVPKYNDPNDVIARRQIQKLYPKHKVVSVDARGDLIH